MSKESIDQIRGPVALLVTDFLGKENDLITSMVLNYIDEEVPDATKIQNFLAGFVTADKANSFVLRLGQLLSNTGKNFYSVIQRSMEPEKMDNNKQKQAESESSQGDSIPSSTLPPVDPAIQQKRAPGTQPANSEDAQGMEAVDKARHSQSAAPEAEESEPAEPETAVNGVLCDSESQSDNHPPADSKQDSVEQQEKGERESQKEGERQDRGTQQKESSGQRNGTEASSTENETPVVVAGDGLPQTDAALKETTVNPAAKSTQFISRSGRKSQSPSEKADDSKHGSRSPRSRSPFKGRRDWLKERLAAYDSTSPGRSGHSSGKSQSPESGAGPGNSQEKQPEDKAQVSDKRHRSYSPHASGSHERRFFFKEKEPSNRRSCSRRSVSHHRSQSPVGSRSERHSDKKRYRSPHSEERRSSRDSSPHYEKRHSSHHQSQSGSRSKSERYSHEKHHRSSERKHSPSRSYNTSSKHERRSSSDHHSPTSKKKSGSHRARTHSRSRSNRRSESAHRSSLDRSPRSSRDRSPDRSPRLSHDRSPTSKKKRSLSDLKSPSKSKSEKQSKIKRKSSHHRSSSSGKKFKHRHKKSKSSSKSKSGKHSSHKEKSSRHRSRTRSKHRNPSRHSSLSSERGRSDCATPSSAGEKYPQYRSYSPSGKATHSRYRSESPRNRSTSPESYLYQQRRLPQYGSQAPYGRAGFSPYMQQLPPGMRYPPNYPNYNKRWTFQQNFSPRNNSNRWIPNNNNNSNNNNNYNNNRNRMGFYRRPGWNNNIQNNRMRNNMNMAGYHQRGRYPHPMNHTNTNYQNRGGQQQQQQRRWHQQTPVPFSQTRRPQTRPYSPASWDDLSDNSPPPRKSRHRSSVSMSPPTSAKRVKKAQSSSASPHRSASASPKRATTPGGEERPCRSLSASSQGRPRSASESSSSAVKKKGSGHSSPSPVELQNLRVVVDNLPLGHDREEPAVVTDRSLSPIPEPESPRPCKEPVFVESSSSEEEEEEEDPPSSGSSASRKNALRRKKLIKKGMIVAPKLPAKRCLSQPAKAPPLKTVKKYPGWSDESEDNEGQVADHAVSDSSDEEEDDDKGRVGDQAAYQAARHSVSASSKESDTEMARHDIPRSSEESEAVMESPRNSGNASEDRDAELPCLYDTDSSEQGGVQLSADRMSDSSEEDRVQAAPHRTLINQKGLRTLSSRGISPPALKTRPLNRTQKRKTAAGKVDPTQRAKSSGYVSPGEMLSSAIRAHLLAKRRQSRKAEKQAAKSSSSSEEDEHWTANDVKVKKQSHSHRCTCSCSNTHKNHLLSPPVKKQLTHAWTQTDISGSFKIEGKQEICNRNKRKRKLEPKRLGLSSDYDVQSSHRQPRETQTPNTTADRLWRREPKVASQKIEKTHFVSSSSASDGEAPPPSPVNRHAKKIKRPEIYTSHSKIPDRIALTQRRRREKSLQEALTQRNYREKTPEEHHSSSCPDIKVSHQSSMKSCTKNAQKHSLPRRHLGTVEYSDSKQDVKRKILQECDAASMIIDISSVPLPSETEPPRKAPADIRCSGSSETRTQQSIAGGAESMTNDQQKSSSIGDSLLITSQNRIYKKAWQCTVSSDSAKKGDNETSSHQLKSSFSALPQPCMPQKESEQAENPGASPSKSPEKSSQASHSESSIVPSNMAIAKEAKADSEVTTKPDSPNKKQIFVKVSSTAKPQILTKKVSLSSSSSENNRKPRSLGKAKKAARLHRSPSAGRRLNMRRPDSKEGEDEICLQPNVPRPSMDRTRTKEEQKTSREGALKPNTPTRQSRSPNMRRRHNVRRSLPKDEGGGVFGQGNVHEPVVDQLRTREGQEIDSEAAVKKRVPKQHSRHSGATGRHLDSCGPDPRNREDTLHQKTNVHELETEVSGAEEGQTDLKIRKPVRTRAPSPHSRSSSASNRALASRPGLQGGGVEILQHPVARRLKVHKAMTREGKEATSGMAVTKRIASKRSRLSNAANTGGLYRLKTEEEKEEIQDQQNVHELVLNKPRTKKGQGMKRGSTPKNNSMPGKHSSSALDSCRLETQDETQYTHRQPNTPKTNALKKSVGSRQGGQVMKKRAAVGAGAGSPNERPHGATPGSNLDTGSRRPKGTEEELRRCPNAHERVYRVNVEGQRIRRGAPIKRRAPGTFSPSAVTPSMAARSGQQRKRERSEDHGYPAVQEIKVEEEGGQENVTGTADKDVFQSGSNSEASSCDSAVKDSGDELERKLREKLLRSLQTKRLELWEDNSRAKRDTSSPV